MEQDKSEKIEQKEVEIKAPFEDFPIDYEKHNLAQKYRYAIIILCLQSIAILLQKGGSFPFPSVQSYARYTGIPYKSLLRNLHVLEEAGACTIVREKIMKNKLKIIPKSVEYYQDIIDANPIMLEHQKKFKQLRGTW